MASNEGYIGQGLNFKCPKCGNENSSSSKYCYKCGEQLLDNLESNLNENNHFGEDILGNIFVKSFFSTLEVTETLKFFSLFFTTNRILIVDTVHFDSMVGYGPLKKAKKIHKELTKMTADEIFSSNWPCLSIPYSQIEKLKIKKGVFNPGYVKITAGEIKDKYIIHSLGLGISTKYLNFLNELKPVLGDRIKIKR